MRASRKARRPIPQEILNAPEVSDANLLRWRCFWDLRRGRDQCMAVPWLDVYLWAQAYGVDTSEMECLQRAVVTLDAILVPHNVSIRKAAEAKAKADAAKPKN